MIKKSRLKWLLLWGFLGSFAVASFSAGFFLRVYHDSLQAFNKARGSLLVSGLRGHEPEATTKIYDSEGNELATAYVENRYPITVDQISPYVIQGLISTEDKTFYEHTGVSVRGILRALWVDITTGARHGGSTITQQLSTDLFLVRDQTIQRKIQEAFIAMEIERQFSKDEILEMYLNQIYFGSGAYGIEAAARTYFGGVSARELTLTQAAMLVGMPKNPSGFSPIQNPDRCFRRRNVVISMLEEEGYIAHDQSIAAQGEELAVEMTRPELDEQWDYFSEYIRRYLVARFGWSAVYEQGLVVYTTLDPDIQIAAEWALDSVLTAKEPVWDPVAGEFIRNSERLVFESSYSHWHDVGDSTGVPDYIQGALVAIDPYTGYIKAMVGGRDFRDSEFNRATQARRQPGSSFKPFVYAEAIEQGWSPGSTILDQPVVIDAQPGFWRPRNYDHQFHGMVTLRTALARSFNVAAVRLGMAVGIEAVAERARNMGIESYLPNVSSLSLGSSMVNPLEMAQAYIPFATGGIAREATAILRIEDRYGNVLLSNEQPSVGRRVLSETGAYLMNSILQSVFRSGTAIDAHWYWGGAYAGRPAGGKTGTTSDYADAWFVGFTPDLVASVWVGYDNHVVRMRLQNGRGQSGSSIALPVWNRFMREVFRDVDPSERRYFPEPPEGSVETTIICKITGKLAVAACAENAMEEMFWAGILPTEYCELHQDLSPFESDTTIPDFTEFDRSFDIQENF